MTQIWLSIQSTCKNVKRCKKKEEQNVWNIAHCQQRTWQKTCQVTWRANVPQKISNTSISVVLRMDKNAYTVIWPYVCGNTQNMQDEIQICLPTNKCNHNACTQDSLTSCEIVNTTEGGNSLTSCEIINTTEGGNAKLEFLFQRLLWKWRNLSSC